MILSIILQANQQGGGLLSMLLPFLLMGAVFYFFMIRPQQKKQKEEKNFQLNLKRGERVVTTAGIHGKIVEVADDGIVLETISGKIKFEKSAVSREFTAARYPQSTTTEPTTTTEEKNN